MFSSLANYLFGGNADQPEASVSPTPSLNAAAAPDVDEEEDWVLIGSSSANDVVAASNGPTSAGDHGDNQAALGEADLHRHDATTEVALTRSGRKLSTPFGSCVMSGRGSLSQMKLVRSSQRKQSQQTTKALKTTALARRNKTVKQHVPIKNGVAGVTRFLKQC